MRTSTWPANRSALMMLSAVAPEPRTAGRAGGSLAFYARRDGASQDRCAEELRESRDSARAAQAQASTADAGCKRVGHVVGADAKSVRRGKSQASDEEKGIAVRSYHARHAGERLGHGSPAARGRAAEVSRQGAVLLSPSEELSCANTQTLACRERWRRLLQRGEVCIRRRRRQIDSYVLLRTCESSSRTYFVLSLPPRRARARAPPRTDSRGGAAFIQQPYVHLNVQQRQ